jgi:single-strand DNA-binding protein
LQGDDHRQPGRGSGDALHAQRPARDAVQRRGQPEHEEPADREWVEETDWFRVSVWGDRAERAAENLRKGNRVFVEGRFKTREFEGRDGQKRTSLEITADSVVNLEKRTREDGDGGQFEAGRPVASGAPAGSSNGPRGGGMDDPDLDDLPF